MNPKAAPIIIRYYIERVMVNFREMVIERSYPALSISKTLILDDFFDNLISGNIRRQLQDPSIEIERSKMSSGNNSRESTIQHLTTADRRTDGSTEAPSGGILHLVTA